VHHPVFPGKPGPTARRIEDETDVRDVIQLLRLNYDRVVARYGLPVDESRTSAGLDRCRFARRMKVKFVWPAELLLAKLRVDANDDD
jgi:hypothetical protein